MWGLDFVGPFQTAPGNYRFILVSIDKFTKWIEVRPVAKVTSVEAAKFMQDITHHFSLPNKTITDLGAAFTGSAFLDFCQDNTIDVYYSSVAHLGATARSNVPMTWFYRLSKIVSLMTPQTMPPGG
jgi:hypothetical protein